MTLIQKILLVKCDCDLCENVKLRLNRCIDWILGFVSATVRSHIGGGAIDYSFSEDASETMSYDPLGVSDAMLDSLSLQLREAEARRVEAERAHQDALAQLRGMSVGLPKSSDVFENLQSRARELEKKAALETVRCEELQLELSAALKSRSGRQISSSQAAGSHHHQIGTVTSSTLPTIPSSGGSNVTWAPQQHHHHQQQQQTPTPGSEIDRIMAKIEQARLSIANDNRILAELENRRTTGPIVSSSLVKSGGIGSSMMPTHHQSQASTNYSSITGIGGGMTGGGSGIGSMMTNNTTMNVLTSSTSSHALTDGPNSLQMGTAGGNVTTTYTGSNVSPLPIRSHQMNAMPPLCQSTTMPVLSLHNTYSLPSGSASYTLGLSGAPVASSYTYPTVGSVSTGGVGNVLGSGLTGCTSSGVGGTGVSSIMGASGLSGLTSSNPLTSTTLPLSLSGFNTQSSYSTYTNPLLSSAAMKLKTLDDIDLGVSRYTNRAGTPCSPIPPATWGIDSYSGIDGVNPAFMHTQRPLSRLGQLDLESRTHGLTLNGNGEPQVDMLDIPGKGRCCVFIARFSYDPPDESEGELSVCAGDYLLVWGSGEPQSGYFDAEMLDGRRGLVPASFVQRLIGDDLLEFHQAVVSTLRDADDGPIDPAPMPQSHNPLAIHSSEDMARLNETHCDFGPDENEDDTDSVPAPRHLTLERQLNKSVLIAWSVPEPSPGNQIESYHVYVDGVLKVAVKASEKTRALVEGVDSNRPHRISVRSVTQTRRTSRDAACTMIIGRDTAHLGPSVVRATHITCSSAVISWLPANSNHQHVVCVNNVEVRTVKPGVYRHTITGLAPSTQYRVTVRAKHLRARGQAPPPGPPPEEAPGAYTDFRTLAKGLPDPPQDIQVESGPQNNTLLVTWQPVTRPPSSGPVTGYAVYADGKKVTDVDSPTGDHALIDIGKLIGLNPRAVTVRTKSRDAQSADSQPTPIPKRAATRKGPNIQQPHIKNQRGIDGIGGQGPGGGHLPHNQQQIIEHDENLSDKEVFPGSMLQHHQQMANQQSGNGNNDGDGGSSGKNSGGIPAIEITKDNVADGTYISDDSEYQESIKSGGGGGNGGGSSGKGGGAVRRRKNGTPHQKQKHASRVKQQQQQQPMNMNMNNMQNMNMNMNQQQQNPQQQQLQQQQQQQPYYGNPTPQGRQQMNQINPQTGQMNSMNQMNPMIQMNQMNQMNPQQMGPQQKKARFFLAMFDYDPSTMSPNPDGCEEELPFREGDTIKVFGDKDPDGFYWGELRGRRGYVPHNMVTEVDENHVGAQGGVPQPGTAGAPSVRGISRDRWGDIYANTPVKRMIALYDYDPQELSPNVDAEQVELSFKTGDVILVYGDMDEDGFFMGELDGVRGLVPSNFLTDGPDQYDEQMMGPSKKNPAKKAINNRGKKQGLGAKGPPPPPRDNMMDMNMDMTMKGMTKKDARPTSNTLLDDMGYPAPDHQTQGMQGKTVGGKGTGGKKGTVGKKKLMAHQMMSSYLMQEMQQQDQQMMLDNMHPQNSQNMQNMQRQNLQNMQQNNQLQINQMNQNNQVTSNQLLSNQNNQQQNSNPQQNNQLQNNNQLQSNQQQTNLYNQQQSHTKQQQHPQQQTTSGGLFSSVTNAFSGSSNTGSDGGGLFGNRQQQQPKGPQVTPQSQQTQLQQQMQLQQQQQQQQQQQLQQQQLQQQQQQQQQLQQQMQQMQQHQQQPPLQQQQQQQPQQQQQQPQQTPFGGGGGIGSGGPFGGGGQTSRPGGPFSGPFSGPFANNLNQQKPPQQQQGPNFMQKINDITAPSGDILSKGKELIFMKFGLGGK